MTATLARALAVLTVLFSITARGQWVWVSPREYLHEAALIAVLDVGQIHQAWTPENILVESATATIEKVVWYPFARQQKLPGTIIVYDVVPNFVLANGNGFSSSTPAVWLMQGRVFAMLKMEGLNKFVPVNQLGFQPLNADGKMDKVRWPTSPARPDEVVTLDRVITELEGYEKAVVPGR